MGLGEHGVITGLSRSIIYFDCETTGSDPETDRIIELGFVQIDQDYQVLRQWQGFVNPTIPIPHEATYGNGADYPGHGITDDMVRDAPTFKDMSPKLYRGFQDCDFAGYNVKRYDLPLVQTEFGRCGLEWSYAGARIIDGLKLWMLGQKRTLSGASEYFLGRKHEGAHRALDDVNQSRSVIDAMLERYPHLPRDIGALHDAQWPVDPNALDPDGKLVWKDGEVYVTFGKRWKGKKLTMMTQKDLRWVATEATGVNKEVRRIMGEAAKGKYPVKP